MSFKDETLDDFSKTMSMSSFPFEGCGMIGTNDQFREFTPKEERQLGITSVSAKITPQGVIRKKPYLRPGSRLTVCYGD